MELFCTNILKENSTLQLHINLVSVLKCQKQFKNPNGIRDTGIYLYLLSKSLHEKGTASWYSSFNHLKDTLKITDQQFLVSMPKFKSSIKKYIKIKKCEHWYHDREKPKDGKLSTYLKLKSNVGFEPYLQIVENLDYRRSITRIRISSHKLQIERGRYNNTPRELRFFNKCNENMIEDEIHSLLHCQNIPEHHKRCIIRPSWTF